MGNVAQFGSRIVAPRDALISPPMAVSQSTPMTSAKSFADRRDLIRAKRKPYVLSADEARAMAFMEEPKRVRQATLEIFEPLWTKCLLYLAGIQHLQPMIGGRAWSPRKAQDWVPLPVINEIQPKVQRIVDFFTRKRPTGYVEPMRQTEVDINAAELGDRILESLWIKGDEDEKQDELATWLATTGNAFKRTYMDTTVMGAARVPKFIEAQEPVLNAAGMPIMGPNGPVMSTRFVVQRNPMDGTILYEDVPQGEVASDVVSPIAMTVPLAVRDLRRSPWMMESQLYALDGLRDMYPEKADFIPEKGAVITSDLYVHRITALLTTGLQGIARTVDPYYMEGFGLVNILERAATKQYPKGMLLVEMDGIPLYIGDLPLENEYSYEHCGYNRVPGRFWFRGVVEDMIAPQDGLNKLEQALQLNDAFNINSIWVCPEGSGIPEGGIKNKPGLVVRYTYPFKPERISGEGLPPQIYERRIGYRDDFDRVSAVQSVIQGTAPPGVTAGVALNRLGEEAEGAFDPITKRFDRFIERCESKKLKFAHKYYTEPRYLTLETDGGNVIEIEDFRGVDLRGNVNFRIEAGSWQPRSKAGAQQMILDAFDRGLLPQVLTDPGQYTEFMERLGVDGFYTTQGLDFKRAKWENEMLTRPEGYDRVIRNSGDDDIVHLTTHTNFRKTKQFLRLPNMIQQRFILHEMEHLQAIVAAQGAPDVKKASEQNDAAAGAGAEGGQPAPGGAQNTGSPPDGGAQGADNVPA